MKKLSIKIKILLVLIAFSVIGTSFTIGEIVGGLMTYQAFMCGYKTQPLINPNYVYWKC